MGLLQEQAENPSSSNLTEIEKATFENFIVDLANVRLNRMKKSEPPKCLSNIIMQANTRALQTATSVASFNTMDELNQGASTLLSIVTTITQNDITGKTFDMAGRESAVDFMTVRESSLKNVQSPVC